MIGLLQENGPCIVKADSNSTEPNPWSWNNYVNMLYIDQPNQVGFSYDVLTNGTFDQITSAWDVSEWTSGVPDQNNTFYVGTTSSQKPSSAANSTENAARSLWHFAQTWFTEFPHYKPRNDKVNIWTESYGGRYGPSFTAYFQKQNEKIANESVAAVAESHYIHLDTLGIINACVDLLVQAPSYPQMAYNNTYDLETINKTVYERAMDGWGRKGGCKDLIQQCRALAKEGDPKMHGNNETVNEACIKANDICNNQVEGPYVEYAGRGYYDITHSEPDPFPPNYFQGYLSQNWVQGALGVPVNFSIASDGVGDGFSATGDYPRADVHGYLEDIAYVLDAGIKVALIYGDRDYACNWIGGEDVSLAVEHAAASAFRAAGYAPVRTNASYVGGQVRQHGNFSFTRVYQAGHEVPAYQPNTAYEIFHRALFDRDIATGKVNVARNSSYSTQGPASTWHIKNRVYEDPEPSCYILALDASCTEDQIARVLNGTAVIKDYVVVG